MYEQWRQEQTLLRLVPATHSVRLALRQLLPAAEGQVTEDAQTVLGLVEVTDDDGLLREAAALGGTGAALVTTRDRCTKSPGGFTGRRCSPGSPHTSRSSTSDSAGAAAPPRRRAGPPCAGQALRRIGDGAAVLSLRRHRHVLAAGAPRQTAAPNRTPVTATS